MTKIDFDKLILMTFLIIIVLITAIYGYRLEIGRHGLKFENISQTK